jgi:hypothetical protein
MCRRRFKSTSKQCLNPANEIVLEIPVADSLAALPEPSWIIFFNLSFLLAAGIKD